ncbi:MAG: hypothetical protein ACYCZU_02025 [Devosia sp.]
MSFRLWTGLLACAAALVIPAVALAQGAPIPMPRPADRMPVVESTANPAPAPDAAGGPEVPKASGDAAAVVPIPDAVAATEAVAAVAAEKQPVTLTAQITEHGMNIPEGLVWRVFDTKTDTSGELALAAKSEEATAQLELVPGEYVVHVAYGRAQASDTLKVTEGDNNKSIVLDAGAMRLNAAVTGDVSIPINLLRFEVFTAGNESDRTLVAQNLSANDIVTLNAGTYHVVSYFGDINAVVRADLRVEPGQMTEATLYHRAAQVTFKLVTETGGEAIADVEWTVKTAGGATVYSNIGAFPATVLTEGDYLVLAKRGETVYNREFEVRPGPGREIEVLTAVY